MSRRTVVAATVGAVLVSVFGAPALADPVETTDERTTVCLRLEPESGEREGVCVWAPVPVAP